jgi:hypothetical protein
LWGPLGWLVNGRILRQRVPPTGQLRTLNRIVPYVRAVEDRMIAPFGVSLLTIARPTGPIDAGAIHLVHAARPG